MKTLIVYDSKFGNTQIVAQALAETFNCPAHLAGEVNPGDLTAYDLLIFGSPTHGGFPSEAVHQLLNAVQSLKGIKAAAFDTRTKTTIFGYAAPKIHRELGKKGAHLLVPPEGFYVLGKEGPLAQGEVPRAVQWAESISTLLGK
jgi:flavodoxin